jgi:hypothetical protein
MAVAWIPAHVDPIEASHEQLDLVSGKTIADSRGVDLRGW